MGSDSVVLLTHTQDFFTVDRVAQALRRLGAVPVRVDTDAYPLAQSLTVHFARGAPRVELRRGRRPLRLDRAQALWVRRLWPGPSPAGMAPKWAKACDDASRTALEDALRVCAGVRVVNPVDRAAAAESKLWQLALARRLGFDVPETLVTNAPAEVRALAVRKKRVVTKLLLPLVQSMGAHPDFHYTSLLSPADLRALDALAAAPQIFQPLVEKARELRVVYVDGACFAGAIDARASKQASVDWRRLTREDGLGWTRETLPRALQARIRRLMRALGLVYGALDFIVTPRRRHVFLEVNPSGEWGWLERDLGLPISAALARALLRRTR